MADVHCPPELARLLLLAWQGKATPAALQAGAHGGSAAAPAKPKRSTRASRARTRGGAKSKAAGGDSSATIVGGVNLPLRCTYSALMQVLDSDESVRIMQDTV